MRLVQALAIGLQVPDDLGNRRDQLTHDLIDVLRRQLPLAPILQAAERSLERRAGLAELRLRSELSVGIAEAQTILRLLRIWILPAEGLPKSLLSGAAENGVRRRLALLDSADNLRQNRQKLPNHLIDVLRAQLPLLDPVAESGHRLL